MRIVRVHPRSFGSHIFNSLKICNATKIDHTPLINAIQNASIARLFDAGCLAASWWRAIRCTILTETRYRDYVAANCN